MKIRISIYFFVAIAVVNLSCTNKNDNPLKAALTSENPKIKRVMDQLQTHEIQIEFTQIDRSNGSVTFKDYSFQVHDSSYFYPASSVKFPIAVLALERLNSVPEMNINTPFYIEGDSIETTVAQDVSHIFAVSDNEANNRLFEFLGQDYINTTLTEKGVSPLRISHRLSAPNSDDVTTKPVIIYLNDSTTTTFSAMVNKEAVPLQLQQIKKGIGYFSDGELQKGAFDFSLKNYYPIQSQHAVLKRIFFPETFTPEQQFKLTPEQHNLLKMAMHTLPRYAGYEAETYYDSYGKFFMYGDSKEQIPGTIKIYNKVGYAYGTLTDCAYIVDEKNGVEFMLTATILVNNNGVFNDNVYEYDAIGIPFLAQLGRELYEIEKNRKK